MLDVKDYIKESERQLIDTKHYRHLEHDLTTKNNAAVNKITTKFKNNNLISNNVSDGLKVESPRTPHFYIQPKLYKEGKPSTPVIISLNCDTSEISENANFHLQPICKQTPSYMKDTADFSCKLDALKSAPDI